MKVTERGNNFAISSDGIATALQDSASSLVAANNSYQQAVALIAAANRVVQDPNSVGAALRTISLRLRGTSVSELEEAGEDTEGAVTSKSKLRGKVQALSGVDILTDTGAYKSTYDILLEISKVWEGMSDIDQAALLEIIAGKTRSNTAAAILSNQVDLEEAYVSALEAEGSALEENEKYLDSIQGRIDLFTNAVQTMWEGTLNDDTVKMFVDIGTWLVKLVDDIGAVRIAFIGLMTVFMRKNGITGLGDLITIPQKKVKSTKDTLADLQAQYQSANQAFMDTGSQEDFKKREEISKRLKAYETQAQAQNNEQQRADLLQEKEEIQQKIDAFQEARGELQEGLSQAIQENITDYAEIDTSKIDDEIASVQANLQNAQQELVSAKSAKWDYYKMYGSQTPAKDRDNRIANAKTQIQELENKLNDLQVQKDNLIKDNANTIADSILGDEAESLQSNLDNIDVSLEQIPEVTEDIGTTGAAGFGRFQKGAKALLKQLGSVAQQLIEMYGLTLLIDAAIKLVEQIVTVFDEQKETAEEAQEAFEELKNELASTESKIKSLNSELDSTNNTIKELMSQGTLSFADKEELNLLKQRSAELERQIDFQEILKETQQQATNTASLHATNKYLAETSFASEQSKSERQEEAKENGAAAGAVIGAILLGGLALLAAPLTAGTSIAAAGAAISSSVGIIGAGGAIAGSFVGGNIGEDKAGKTYTKEQSVGDAIKNMQAQRAALIQTRDEALDSNNTDAYNSAVEALANYDEAMSKHMTQIQENYNAMDWETDDTEQKEAIQQQMDMLDEYNILMGTTGAKENAIGRLLSETGFTDSDISEAVQKAKDAYIQALNNGEQITLSEAFGDDTEAYQELKTRFYNLGLYISDAENYLIDFKKAEDEASETNFADVAKSINSVTSGVDSLKSAFEEATEKGLIMANTVTELNETFGNIDAISDEWDTYLSVMMSGVATTEQMVEATRQLAEAWVDNKLIDGPMTQEEQIKTIAQLYQMGVTNAKEFFADANEESAWDAVYGLFGDDKVPSESDIQAKLKEYGIEATIEKISQVKAALQRQYDLQQQYDEVDTNAKNAQHKERLQKQADELERILSSRKLPGFTQETREVQTMKRSGPRSDQVQMQISTELVYVDKDGKEYTEEEYKDLIVAKQQELTKLQEEINKIEVDPSLDPAEAEARKTAIQAQIDAIAEDIDMKFTADVKMELELQDASEMVDEIQSVYDTLVKAEEEYNEQGYYSVDTLQSILSLEPQYISMLIDENGNLNLNRDTLEQVAIARIQNMAQKAKEAILTDALTLAEKGNIEALYAYGDAALDAAEKTNILVEAQLRAISATFEKRMADPDDELFGSNFDVDAYVGSVTKSLDAIDIATASTVNNIRGALSSSSSGGGGDSALDTLTKKYENQISNLDNQKTYLENEIERLEAEEKGVSKKYYEEQIDIEKKKLGLYAQEKKELTTLLASQKKGSEEWWETTNAIWDVTHAVQQSTTEIVNMRHEIVELYNSAFQDLDSAFGNKDSWFSKQQDYIDKYQELLELNDVVPPASTYEAQIASENKKMENVLAEYYAKAALFNQGLEQGDFQVGDDIWAEKIQELADLKLRYQDAQIAAAQYAEEEKKIPVDTFDRIRTAFENRTSYYSNQQDYINGYIDYLESLNIDPTEDIYEELISIEEKKRASNLEDLTNARAGFEKIEAAGYTAADEEWVNAYNRVVELERSIQDSDKAMAEWNKTILEMDFSKFDDFIDRINRLNDELKNVYDLMSDEDMAFETDGSWTKEGITSLAMLYHQLENNKNMLAEYAQEVDELTEKYEAGEISENDYLERWNELQDGQWDSIKTIEDLRDSIVDINEARIDLVEDGINKEIEAYQDLIDVKKQELDAERNLYEFKKNVEDQTKNLANLERKIAALSGSTSQSDVAERRRLEAELYEARSSLDDTYYNNAKDAQSTALDNEMTNTQKSADYYIEQLREKLENVDELIENTLTDVLLNADVTLSTLNDISAQYGIQLSNSLINPWQQAAQQATETKNNIDIDLTSLINEDGVITRFSNEVPGLLTIPFEKGGMASSAFQTNVTTIMEAIKLQAETDSSELADSLVYPWDAVNAEDGPITTFSEKINSKLAEAVQTTQEKCGEIGIALEGAWNNTDYIDLWAQQIIAGFDNVIAKAKETAAAINNSKDTSSSSTPSYTSSTTTKSNSGSGSSGTTTKQTTTQTVAKIGKYLASDVLALGYGPISEARLNQLIQSGAVVIKNGKPVRTASSSAIKSGSSITTPKLKQSGYLDATTSVTITGSSADKVVTISGTKYAYDSDKKQYYRLSDGQLMGSSSAGATYRFVKPTAIYKYAKGTTKTKEGQWAITDEPQYGEELTLVPGKDGNLSFLRKGTGVVPADMTKRLFELAQMPIQALGGNIVQPNFANVSTNNTSVNVNFDALVKADNITNDVLADVEKAVAQQLEAFTKKLNYSLKTVGAR